jgi:hypothetical protein
MKPKLTKKEAKQVKKWLDSDTRSKLCPFGTGGCLVRRENNPICVAHFPRVLKYTACPCRCYRHAHVVSVAKSMVADPLPDDCLPHNWTRKTISKCAALCMEQLVDAHLNYVDSVNKRKTMGEIIESYFKIKCAVDRGETFIKRGKLV